MALAELPAYLAAGMPATKHPDDPAVVTIKALVLELRGGGELSTLAVYHTGVRALLFWLTCLAPALACINDEELPAAEDYLRAAYHNPTDALFSSLQFLVGPVALVGLLLLLQSSYRRRRLR